jgi:hypothetical protein
MFGNGNWTQGKGQTGKNDCLIQLSLPQKKDA